MPEEGTGLSLRLKADIPLEVQQRFTLGEGLQNICSMQLLKFVTTYKEPIVNFVNF